MSSSGVDRWAAVLLVLASAVSAHQAGGQCTAVSGPTQIVQPSTLPDPKYWTPLPYDIVVTENDQKLLVPANYGFGSYSLASPGSPQLLGWTNLIQLLGAQCGDGQSYIAKLGASDDGQRVLISLSSTMACRGDTLVANPDGSNGYTLTGDFNPPQFLGGAAVQNVNGRRIAWGLHGSTSRVYAADVTDPPGFRLAPGAISPDVGNIPSSYEPRSDGALSDLTVTSPYVVFIQGMNVTVMDASNPGPAPSGSGGNNPSITSGMPLWTVGAAAFGRAAGENFLTISAVKDPDPASLGKKVYILAAFQSATNQPTGFSLVKLDTNNGSVAITGQFNPLPPYSGPLAIQVPSVTLYPDSSGDVLAFMWTKRASTGLPDRGALRLYTTTARSFGTNPGTVDVNLASYPIISSVSRTRIVKPTTTDAYAYLATGSNAFVMKLNCVPPVAPATSGLRVFSGATELPGDGTATAFLGDSLTVQPTVAPANSAMPISSWRVDWNFHPTEDNLAGYPRVKFPDSSGSGDPGGPWTYVGPCDPQASGGVVSTGQNCWASVLNNGGFGGPDFTSNPAAGSTKALSLALEACNSHTPCSSGPAVFPINWKVPTVRLKNASILTGAPVQDGSDGHPSATGYKWYFGTSPTSPPGETMVLDSSCTGPSCNHTFPGNGTFNVWLTVPYANGYSTPDCASPCVSQVSNQLTAKVTDLVPAFQINGSTTAPTTTYLSAGSLRVDDVSQKAAGITVTRYDYCLSAPGTACTPGQPFTPGAGAIPLPQVGNFWLYIRMTYSGGSQPSADWTPAVVSDPKAWPVNVQSLPPALRLTNVSPCGGFCQDVYAYVGDTITAAALVGGAPDPNPPSGLNWTITPSSAVNLSTGTGQNYSFTITSQTDFTITMNGYGSPVTRTVTVLVRNPLSVSVSANPTSAAPGAPISFTANATGGSGSYISYSWNFGDGAVGTGQSVSHSYSSAQSYTSTCTVRDSSNASASGYAYVTISSGGGPGGGSVDFNILNSGSPAGGGNTSVGFSAPAGVTLSFVPFGTYSTYSWNFGDGSPLDNTRNPTHTYSAAGSFTVTLTTNTGSRSTTLAITGSSSIGTPEFKLTDATTAAAIPLVDGAFTVFGGQRVRFTPIDAANGNQAYAGAVSWSFGDPAGSTSSSNPALFTYNVSSDNTFTARLTIVAGSKTVEHPVNVLRPVTGAYTFLYLDGSVPNVSKVDAGRPIAFTAAEGWADAYGWDFGDGSPFGTTASVIHSFARPGTFTVTLRESRAGRVVTTASPTVFSVLEAPLWVIPGLASAKQGQLPGSSYVSDVAINNPSSTQTARYQIAILDGKPLEWKAFTFFPNQTILFDNIVAKWFQRPDGAYALLVKGDEANPTPPVISATTYNNNQGDTAKGTYGVSLPVLRTSSALAAGASSLVSSLAGLRDVPKPPDESALELLTSWPNVSAAYTNVGLVNTGTETATVEVHFKTTTGESLGAGLGSSFTTFVAPNQTVQFTRPLQNKAGVDVLTNPVASYLYSVNIVSGAGVVPYASVSDIGSSDPVFVSPRPQGPLSSTYRVPGVVRASGANGTFFKSRFVLYNPSTSTAARTISLTYSVRACDPTNYCLPRLEVHGQETLRAGETKTWEDFVADWVTANPDDLTRNFVSAWIDVAPADTNNDPLVVRAETYNAQPSGNFGTQVPGFVPAQDAVSPTGPNRKLVVPRVVQSEAYRTNLVFFLLSGTTASAKVTFYAKSGMPLQIDPLYFTLTGDNALFQLNSSNAFWSQVSASDKAAGLSVIIEAVDGFVGAYSSQVDNFSGDQTLVPGAPLP